MTLTMIGKQNQTFILGGNLKNETKPYCNTHGLPHPNYFLILS
jgi:hypothetical protein